MRKKAGVGGILPLHALGQGGCTIPPNTAPPTRWAAIRPPATRSLEGQTESQSPEQLHQKEERKQNASWEHLFGNNWEQQNNPLLTCNLM